VGSFPGLNPHPYRLKGDEMRFAVLLFLCGLSSAQTFTADPTVFEKKEVQVHFFYTSDPDFVEDQCFWQIYSKGKPQNKPAVVEGCHSIDYTFEVGEHAVELVVNGRQKKYQHLSIEQRRLVKKITIGSRVKVE